MLTVLHGDNVVESRMALSSIKEEYQEIITLAGDCDLTTIKQALESPSMFSQKRLVIIENLLSTKRRDKKEALSYINVSVDFDVILWEKKKIDKNTLSNFQKASTRLFRLKDILFKFLDNIVPGNQNIISLFHQLLKKEPVELIFFHIIRRTRLILALKTKSNIAELTRLSPWQQKILLNQAAKFTEDELLKLYDRLFHIDLKQKTGRSGLSLVAELDILFIGL